MDHKKTLKARDTVVNIDSVGSEPKDDRRNEPRAGHTRSKVLRRSKSGTLTYEDSEGECSSNSYKSSVKSSDDEYGDIESLIRSNYRGKNWEHQTHVNEKHKASGSKKAAPKPPRPRKGPSLDMTDLQLVKEISEQAMKKRVRVERLKALKKRRAAKVSSSSSSLSSNSSVFAIIVTVLFLLVIILQGFGSSESSTLGFHDSPKPSGLISIQFGNNVLENNGGQQISTPPDFVEQKSSSKSRASAM